MWWIITIDHNLGYFECIFDQVWNHEGVLREVSEMSISTPFGRCELNAKTSAIVDKPEFAVISNRILTQWIRPLFQHTRTNMSLFPLDFKNVVKRMRKFPTILIWTPQVSRGKTFLSMKMTVCSARGWGWPVEKLNNRNSKTASL